MSIYTAPYYTGSPVWMQEAMLALRGWARGSLREGPTFRRELAEVARTQWLDEAAMRSVVVRAGADEEAEAPTAPRHGIFHSLNARARAARQLRRGCPQPPLRARRRARGSAQARLAWLWPATPPPPGAHTS